MYHLVKNYIFYNMQKTIGITASGKVQGVFYRHSTKEKAISLGITGEVQNLANGNVYIIATGGEDQLHLLVNWCKSGPRRAVVTGLEIEALPLRQFEGFNIIR